MCNECQITKVNVNEFRNLLFFFFIQCIYDKQDVEHEFLRFWDAKERKGFLLVEEREVRRGWWRILKNGQRWRKSLGDKNQENFSEKGEIRTLYFFRKRLMHKEYKFFWLRYR